MADFAPGIKAEDILKSQLRCSSCSVIMKPNIYRCSSDHSVCSKCWASQEKCSKCDEVFEKEFKQNILLDHVYAYWCPGCKNLETFNARLNPLSSLCHGQAFAFSCNDCIPSLLRYRYPHDRALYTIDEFLSMKNDFKPRRNYQLEALTAFMVYPCEMEGCTEKVSLADTKNHEANCAYRCVDCPCSGCEWKGPVHSLDNHVSDVTIHPDCATFDSKDGQPLSLELSISTPVVVIDALNHRKVFIYKGSVASVFCISLNIPESASDDIQLSVENIGQKSVSDNLSVEVHLQSKLLQKFITHGISAQSDIEAAEKRKWEPLRSLKYLKEEGYADTEGVNCKITLYVKVREIAKRIEGTELLPVITDIGQLMESVD